MSGNDFWTSGTGTGNGKFHSHFRERECECEWQIPFPFSGTGMQINRKFHSRLSGTENFREIPGKFHSHLRERECKWKIPFPFSGTGMRVANSIPDFRDGNWRPVFPGIPAHGWGFWNFCSHFMGVQIFQISMFEKSCENICEFLFFRLKPIFLLLGDVCAKSAFSKKILFARGFFWAQS